MLVPDVTYPEMELLQFTLEENDLVLPDLDRAEVIRWIAARRAVAYGYYTDER